MNRALALTQIGMPLSLINTEPKMPKSGEVLIRHSAIGVNFIDIYHRNGLYPLPLPHVLGVEASGTIEAVGENVHDLKPGDRVAYAGAPVGAYADIHLLPANRALKLPDIVDESSAAAMLLKGLTAHMLLTRTFPVLRGTIILVHAAAGGLGSILTHWAKQMGATVIGTVSTDTKAALAVANGADHIIVGRDADWASDIRNYLGGQLVDVAYDGIGGTSLLRTFDCVRPFGMVASIGQAGGQIAPISVDEIGPRRSLSLSRPSVMAYAADLPSYRGGAAALFAAMEGGWRSPIGTEFPLEQANIALSALEIGATTGSVLLLP
ncbi:MAG: quinone oxidoreductase [Hyphomicrobiales bacterium]|nr:quinone oxidoreductase [Hyphomicrobiales bacterium]MDE2115072.1 quinone oxidoreductase [Hyphomicrobiales bacterium]